MELFIGTNYSDVFKSQNRKLKKLHLAFRDNEDYLKREKMVNRHLVFDSTRDNVASIGKMSVYNNLIKFPICTTNIHMEYLGFIFPYYTSAEELKLCMQICGRQVGEGGGEG